MSPEQKRAQEELQPTGKKIRATRTQVKLTQKAMAVYCNLHYNHLGKLERGAGNVDLLTLVKLSFAVQLPVFSRLNIPANAIRRNKVPTPAMITRRLNQVLKITGGRILHQLEEKNMTQEALAGEMEIDRSEVNRYAHGLVNIQYVTLVRMAMELGIDTQALLTRRMFLY